jgi:aldehyde:ferredoxin oxidoreductase
MCKFQTLFMSPATLSYEEYSRLVRHVSGLDISASEMNEAAERIYTMERMFNVREGATRKDDYPPERFMTEPTPATGILSFQRKVIDREKYEQQLDEYYQAHGWDEKGIPKPATLGRLGLDREPSHLL